MHSPGRLSSALKVAFADRGNGLAELHADQASDWRDALCALIAIHDLHTAPLPILAGAEWLQHDVAVVILKCDLEAQLMVHLGHGRPSAGSDTVGALRALARRDLVPAVYDWLAWEATAEEVKRFLEVEGGPDGGFDDLVAICQVGLTGLPKLVLAANYWDEMGRGSGDAVHTELHRRLTVALDLQAPPVDELPIEALERAALNGLLATNRALQPEMIGALGLLELQAGPRCRRVVTALHRIGAPADALPFYEEHATADPRHGRDWLERGVKALVEALPEWGPRIERGAQWRADVNHRLFGELHRRSTVGTMPDAA